MKTALVLFAHGSPVDAANDAVREVARKAGAAGGFDRAEVAFLEPYPPWLAETVAALDDNVRHRHSLLLLVNPR
jgi:sirohydrochlorin ferrochelatase